MTNIDLPGADETTTPPALAGIESTPTFDPGCSCSHPAADVELESFDRAALELEVRARIRGQVITLRLEDDGLPEELMVSDYDHGHRTEVRTLAHMHESASAVLRAYLEGRIG